jgi:hypothetical protein
MAYVTFEDRALEREHGPRIDYALRNIAVGPKPGHWQQQADEIVVHRRLAGGRSDSEVLEVTVRRGNQQSRKVVKVGPLRELRGEYLAFDRHLRNASAVFAPIEAGTPAVVDEETDRNRPQPPDAGKPQALVYDHASRFAGMPTVSPRTLEERAREAVQAGGDALDEVVEAIGALFEAARNDLYDISNPRTGGEGGLATVLNRRLGPALEIEVDRMVRPKAERCRLTLGQLPPDDLKKFQIRYPQDLFEASTRLRATIEPGDRVHLFDLNAAWWGEQLMGDLDDKRIQVKVIAEDPPVASVAGKLKEGEAFDVYGKVRSTRARAHHQRLSAGPLVADGGLLKGDSASVPDPFVPLHALLTDDPSDAVWTVAHGDLNPRNVLLIDDRACLIDFAFTAAGQPIFADFARLEGSLARDTLPAGWSWAQHVRLQRLLATACRLGDGAADRFAELLGAEEPSMGSAFRLLWAIRRAARAVYPSQGRRPWWREYLTQLSLYAHLALKWPDPGSSTLPATAAMAGVAAEVLGGRTVYRLWSDEDLRVIAGEVLELLGHDPGNALEELAWIVAELDRRRLPKDERERIDQAAERVRSAFVRTRFEDPAYRTIHRLKADHEVYISLRAYIGLTGRLHEPVSRGPRGSRTYSELLEGDGPHEEPGIAGPPPDDADLALLLDEVDAARTGEGDGGDVLELLTGLDEVVVLGDAGAGKSTVARELEYRLADATVTQKAGKLPPRMPVILRAPRIAEQLRYPVSGRARPCEEVLFRTLSEAWPADLLTVGALHVTVDALNELDDQPKARVAEWLTELRRRFPRTPVVACHRLYGYVPGLLPFPSVTLDKVAPEQAERYIHDYLRENGVPDHEAMATELVGLLLDPDQEQVRDLAQTPLFLWMIASRYRETGIRPSNRGQLFGDFTSWYMEQRHHTEHGERVAWEFGYEQKSELLGAVAAVMVERGSTEIGEDEVVPPLIPESLGPSWRGILEEIVRSEMARRGDGKLRFLHQSFQEYFAARHFLRTAADDPGVVRSRVHSLRWHDTFTILLGFAGEHPEVVTRVIQTALEVDPTLTARCLRVAERPEPELLDRFVAEQEATLRDPLSGDFAHARAATALAVYGRGRAHDVLVELATDPAAPVPSRAEAIHRLAGALGNERVEQRQRNLRNDLVVALKRVLEEPAPAEVRRAAVDAAVRVRLTALSQYVTELVDDSEPWLLAHRAYQALLELGVAPGPKLQARYTRLCHTRLPETEQELYAASTKAEIATLQAERVAILQQLAEPANLELLLRRRFALGIADQVGPILDQVIELPGDVPVAAQPAWAVLRDPLAPGPRPLESLLRLLADADALTAVAATHRILDADEDLSGDEVIALLDPDLASAKLCALAALLREYWYEDLFEARHLDRAEQVVRTLADTVESPDAIEALACLVEAIQVLDEERGQRLAAVVDYRLGARDDITRANQFPWIVTDLESALGPEDYQTLLAGDAADVAVAIRQLASFGSWYLKRALPVEPVRLDDEVMALLNVAAVDYDDPSDQRDFACAAAEVAAVGLLPWLLDIVDAPGLAETFTNYDDTFVPYQESDRAAVLEAIGYLARRLGQPDSAIVDRATLTLRRFTGDEDRSTAVGAVTGLGYLGDWKVVLRALGPGEPWLHVVAQNVCQHWVPAEDLESATRWITCRLRDEPELHPDVRSTLERVKESNERQLGHHVPCE